MPGTADAPFRTVQRAVNAADESVTPGADTVHIARGSYSENVVVDDVDSLTIHGNDAVISAPDTTKNAATIRIREGDLTIHNLSTEGGLNGIVARASGSVELRHVTGSSAVGTFDPAGELSGGRGVDINSTPKVGIQGGGALENIGDGLRVRNAHVLEIVGGTYHANDDGLDLENNADVRAVSLTATENRDEGVEVDGSQSVTFIGGIFARNTEAGLDIDDSKYITLIGVLAVGNGEHGLQITAGDDLVENSVIERVSITGSTFTGNTGDGVNIVAEDDGSLVRSVTATGVVSAQNTESGFDITALDFLFRGVRSLFNGDPDNLNNL
jgi:hypothetical protein